MAWKPTEKPWRIAAQERIDQQTEMVAAFEPGCAAHRQATEVLLKLQDSLFVMHRAMEILDQARRRSTPKA